MRRVAKNERIPCSCNLKPMYLHVRLNITTCMCYAVNVKLYCIRRAKVTEAAGHFNILVIVFKENIVKCKNLLTF